MNCFQRPAQLASLVCLSLIVAACAWSGPGHDPATSVTLSELGISNTTSVALPRDWWTQWQQSDLNHAIDLALAKQPTLAIAKSRLRAAQAVTESSQANRFPQVGLGYDASRERFSQNGFYPPPLAGNAYNVGNLQLVGSLELDVFGQRTAEIAAGLNQTLAARAELDAASLTLAAQVAKTYLALARMVSQEKIVTQMQQARRDMAALVAQRVKAGLDLDSAYQNARTALHAVNVLQTQLHEQQSVLQHQLAALTGQGPQAFEQLRPELEAIHLPALQSELALDLLARRPDVNAAKWRVESALQGVKASERLFYPNVSLNGFAGVSAIGMSNLMQSASRQQGVGLAVHLPMFDGGRLRALLKIKQSELDANIAQYNALVIDAVRESADAISALQSLDQQAHEQQQAVQATERAFASDQARFEAGLTHRIALLQSQLQLLEQQRQHIEVLSHQHIAQVDLIKALGGGWQAPTAQRQP